MSDFLTPHDIMITLDRMGVETLYGVFQAADRDYFAVPEEWMTDVYADFYQKSLKFYGVNKWRPLWDCDDFSRAYAVGAQICWAQNREKSSLPEGCAVGEVWYTSDKLGRHAINIVCVQPGAAIRFVEPQTCKFIELSKAEIKSINFIRL